MLHNYDIIREAIFTERSTSFSEKANTYTFRVATGANKIQIKDAVEEAFHVKVAHVRIINVHPKQKMDRYRGIKGQTRGYKKAMVKLEKGHIIEFV